MKEWHKTSCVLCAINCGLEVLVEDNKMIRVKPDKDNPRSQGYACRKGLNILYHQYPINRLTEPLKKVNGKFEPISWDQAIEEIGEKLKGILEKHSPRSLAYLGSSSQAGHFEAAFGVTLLKSLGSQYLYTSAGQEFSGVFWLQGRMFGKQYNVMIPDEHETEMLVAWGWNGIQSHQMPQAPKVLKQISKDPERLLVSIDPRRSETAAIADIHLAIKPGTDALLAKAMIAVITQEGWEDKAYIKANVEGWDALRNWFDKFDVKAALKVCELEYEDVYELCRLMSTKNWSVHPDLGIYMGRHSVLNSYFMNILGAVCGIFCKRGGNNIPGMVMPIGSNADERNPDVWRTVATNMPPAAVGSYPASVLPEEILSDHPDRLRAVILSACNPLRSWPDTAAFEKAFEALDLLVVSDIVMTETARLADYVLPCRTFYESWDGNFFPLTYPNVYFQMRPPIVKPEGNCLEASQILTRLAIKMGIVPEIPKELIEAASSDRMTFGAKLMTWVSEHPNYLSAMPYILAETLGKEWDSAALAALWGMMMTAPKNFRENAARIGFETGIDMGDKMFQAILDSPQGLWVGKADVDHNMANIKTPSGKIELVVPELSEMAEKIDAESEAKDLKMPDDFPLVLNAGRHMDKNINTMMRNPKWNKGKRDFTIAVNPILAEELDIKDGEPVRVTTEAGTGVGELEVNERVRKNMVLIPHGFGLINDEKVHGININYLTKNTHRDLLGTPMHRFVPCRLEKA